MMVVNVKSSEQKSSFIRFVCCYCVTQKKNRQSLLCEQSRSHPPCAQAKPTDSILVPRLAFTFLALGNKSESYQLWNPALHRKCYFIPHPVGSSHPRAHASLISQTPRSLQKLLIQCHLIITAHVSPWSQTVKQTGDKLRVPQQWQIPKPFLRVLMKTSECLQSSGPGHWLPDPKAWELSWSWTAIHHFFLSESRSRGRTLSKSFTLPSATQLSQSFYQPPFQKQLLNLLLNQWAWVP